MRFRVVLAFVVFLMVIAAGGSPANGRQPVSTGPLLQPLALDDYTPSAGISSPRGGSYRIGGKRWPGRVIPVVDQTRGFTRRVVTEAMNLWNRSGARIRFKRKSSGRKLLIRIDRSFDFFGFATVGYSRPGTRVVPPDCPPGVTPDLVSIFCPGPVIRLGGGGGGVVWLEPVSIAKYLTYRSTLVTIAVHELGHSLGLEHVNSSCLAMNSTVGLRCRIGDRESRLRVCQIPMPGDARGAVKLYGGRVRIRAPKRLACEKFRQPGTPDLKVSRTTQVQVSVSGQAGYLPPPEYPRGTYGGETSIHVIASEEVCGYSEGRNVTPEMSRESDLTIRLKASAKPGVGFSRKVPNSTFDIDRWNADQCAAAFVSDRFGRSSGLSAPVPLP